MAGCVPCFVIPLLLFIFHRYIQPILLKFWNPWAKVTDAKEEKSCEFSCECAWMKKDKNNSKENELQENENLLDQKYCDESPEGKLKAS